MLSQRQLTIAIGTLLGDGAMRCKANALLEINHSASQRPYVDWLYQEFREIVGTPPRLRSTNGSRVAYRFTTLSVSQLTPLFHAFYPSGKKEIPAYLPLDPLSLAVWFMDDGSRSRSSIYLNTQQFNTADQQRLIAMLGQLGLTATLNKDKHYYRLRVSTGSMPRFASLVGPHIIPEMRYKLPAEVR